jgi:hypothetical protein
MTVDLQKEQIHYKGAMAKLRTGPQEIIKNGTGLILELDQVHSFMTKSLGSEVNFADVTFRIFCENSICQVTQISPYEC